MDVTTIVAIITSLDSTPYIGPIAVRLPIYLPIIISIGALISMILPAPPATASPVYKFLYAVVQWCALNKGHGVNLSAPSSAGIVGGPGAIDAPMMAVTVKPAAPSLPVAGLPGKGV